MNLAALAAAALAPKPYVGPVAPVLSRVGLSSRAARLSDITSGWFSYWARELALPAEPNGETWRKAAALQALYEAGLLQAGVRLRVNLEEDRLLSDYLRSLSVTSVSDHGEPFDGWLATGPITLPAGAFARQARYIWIGDFSFAGEGSARAPDQPMLGENVAALMRNGWAAGELSFDLGDHPLDRYVALPTAEAELLGGTSPLCLRVASVTALTTPYILIADRTG